MKLSIPPIEDQMEFIDFTRQVDKSKLMLGSADATFMDRLATCAQALLDTGETNPVRVLGSIAPSRFARP